MTKEQRQQLKRIKADTIAACATIIAEHCDTVPEKVFTEIQSKCHKVREARSILIHHLNNCGMTFDRIGKLLQRNPGFCQKANRDFTIRMMSDDFEILKKLPFVPNSLECAEI